MAEDKLQRVVKVAKLDSNLALIGIEEMTFSQAREDGRIILPKEADLPLDGTYKWVPGVKAFYPLGFGIGRPTRPPFDRDHAFYAMILMLKAQGISVGNEAEEWSQWYSTSELKRADELHTRHRRAQRQKGARE